MKRRTPRDPAQPSRPKSAPDRTFIHPTAVVHPHAGIGAGCQIGPYCVIGEHVTLGPDCRLHSHVVVDGHTSLGRENELFPFSSLGLKTQDLKWKGGINRVTIGDRNTFREHATVHCATNDGDATVLGSGNLLLCYCHIAHDCQVGNHVIMSGYAGLAGHVIIEDHAIVGSMAGVHQFCRVGCMSIIGGCSKVVQDVPPYMLADGNPAETRTVNKVGIERHGVSEDAQEALRRAYKILFRSGLTVANALAKITTELPRLPEIKHLVQFVRSSERGICK